MQIISKFISPNFSIREESIKYIILHFSELTFDEALDKLCNQAEEVSCHYLIKVTGEIFQLVEDHQKAWHAGISSWQGDTQLNNSSIGIELDNLGDDHFTLPQMNSCIELCKVLVARHNIAPSCVIGHSDIAPDRKIDPGIFFNWEKLAANGLGIWPKKHKVVIPRILLNYGDESKEVATMQHNLKQLGYKLEVSGKFDSQTNFVVRAFQSHFNQAVIHTKGIKFYQNYNSKYSWDLLSNLILCDLLGKPTNQYKISP